MKNRLQIAAALATLIAVLGGFSLPAYAGIIAGNTSSSQTSSTATNFRLGLGTGLTGQFRYAYFAINDTSATGKVYAVLYECDNASYNTNNGAAGCAYYAESNAGFTDSININFNNSGHRVLEFDFFYTFNCTNDGCFPPSHATNTSGITLNPSKFYWLYISEYTLSHTFSVLGNSIYLTDFLGNIQYCRATTGNPTSGNCSPVLTAFWEIADAPIEGAENLVPASSSSGLELSGARTFCDSAFADSTFGITNGLCFILGYLFIPSQQSLNDFKATPDILKSKIPVSYFYSGYSIVSNISSSSGTFPSVVLPFNLPGAHASVSLFSLSAIQTYMTASAMSIFRALMVAAIWLSLFMYFWHTIRRIV